MKIKIKIPIGGNGFIYRPKEIVEVPNKQALKWIAVGYAEEYEDPSFYDELDLNDISYPPKNLVAPKKRGRKKKGE